MFNEKRYRYTTATHTIQVRFGYVICVVICGYTSVGLVWILRYLQNYGDDALSGN